MINEIVHFLLHVLASVCGILLGAWLAGIWERFMRKMKQRKRP